MNAEQSAEEVVRTLWSAAHDTALAWDSEHTDTDRFYEALNDLHENADIDVALFGNIFDIDSRPELRGTCALLASAWHDFSPELPTRVTIALDSCQQDILISEIALDVLDAFARVGLKAEVNDDFSVTVTVIWRHHVLSIEDALEAADLLPR
ncbi:hypothetical protein [Gulosibacter chungangensis]|uniref:Uncharacterized protein n=1 Tax=Gulosibacter chungangensis TaxID=979746 RepID=A0A7J5BA80_9MICO|nr:hypothetical protein [Gulosibacter chungangensis]KAB1642159.1 hypothetical protein F8O05_10055 [Gulosibacter chungangensis]